jgi:hypothetical protein
VTQSIAPEARGPTSTTNPSYSPTRDGSGRRPNGSTAYIHAHLRDSDAIFDHPDLRKVLDLSQPVALMLIAVLHFSLDAANPYACVSRLVGGLASCKQRVAS